MTKLFLLLFALFLFATSAEARWAAFPGCAYTGDPTCNKVDGDQDGTRDSTPPALAFQEIAGGYLAVVDNGQLVGGYAEISNASAVTGSVVGKPSGTNYLLGEIALRGNFADGDYNIKVKYLNDVGPLKAWFKFGSSHRLTPVLPTTLSQSASPQFVQLTQGGVVWQPALNGETALYIKAEALINFECVILWPVGSAEPTADCDGGAGGEVTPDHVIQELGSETAPVAWNSAAFTNANIVQFTGSELNGTACGGTLTIKILWDDTTTDRGYLSANCADTDDELPDPLLANDASNFGTVNQDAIYFRWRADLNQVFDTNMYAAEGNLQPVYRDADWSGSNNAINTATNLNTTIVRNIVSSTSWNLFMAFDLGSNIAADTLGLCNFAVQDKDEGVTSVYKYFHSNSITDATKFGTCKWAAETVPASGGGGDVTAPVVTLVGDGVINETASSAQCTATTDEAGTAKCKYSVANDGTYELEGSGESCTTTCVATMSGLAANTSYWGKVSVTDAAGNEGLSAEFTFTTLADTLATLFVSSTGSGTTCTSGSPCLPGSVWALLSPGSIVDFAAGTYQGVNEMINPPIGLSGTQSNPITLRCPSGICLIDAQFASDRTPIKWNNNNWFIFEGFTVANALVESGQGGALINVFDSDNNIFRKIIGWDGVFQTTNDSSNNLFEWYALWGFGRKMTQSFHSDNTVWRNGWVCHGDLDTGQANSLSPFYNDTLDNVGTTYENVFASWCEETSGSLNLSVFTATGYHPDDRPPGHGFPDMRVGMYGSMVFQRTAVGSPPNVANRNLVVNDSDGFQFTDVVSWMEPGRQHGVFNDASRTTDDATVASELRNVSFLGGSGTAPFIASSWDQVNVKTGTVSSVYGADSLWSNPGTKGATICKEYLNKVRTANGLFDSEWDDFFVTRLNAAIVSSGRTVLGMMGHADGLKAWLGATFGPIHEDCQ